MAMQHLIQTAALETAPKYSWARAPIATAISGDGKGWLWNGGSVVWKRCAFSVFFVAGLNVAGFLVRFAFEAGPATNGAFWMHMHAGLASFSLVYAVVVAVTRGRLSVVVVLSMLTIWFSITFGIFLLMTMAVSLAAID
ncbi:unnamed protein product, partial [Mesorhabditis spiculigera]